jgi:hypothetical protein
VKWLGEWGAIVRREIIGLFAALLLASSAPASFEWHEALSKHFHVYADESWGSF